MNLQNAVVYITVIILWDSELQCSVSSDAFHDKNFKST